MGIFNGVKNWVMPAEDDIAVVATELTAVNKPNGERVKIRIENPRDFIEAPSLLADLRRNNCLLVNLNEIGRAHV